MIMGKGTQDMNPVRGKTPEVSVGRLRQPASNGMTKYTMTEAAKILGVHRQTMINWIRRGWIKPKRDYKDWPVFTDECIKKIKEWRETLKD
ncbi:MAG: helix-turn-helix domain-containing protein [Candidatus Omnitrophica bacterium]|nr:helix-turn-helix domain-containing protein [Candidatus Omnitrophota bacterium]